MCSHTNGGGGGSEIGLSDFIRNTVRRYDVLVKVHAKLYLKGDDEGNKRALTAIFVEKTFDELAAICENSELRGTVSKYLYAYTNRVITDCHSSHAVSPEALPRLGFYYLYGLHLLPGRWIAELKKLETLCYRDVACVYDRYVAVKTAMANVFTTISDFALRLMFGKGDD